MNPNQPNPWLPNYNPPPLLPFQVRPLMAVPIFAMSRPQFVQQFLPDSAVMDTGATPPYAALTSPFFTRQVPPSCLPHLRFPPPNPPLFRDQGPSQPIWNPYLTPPYSPTFGPIFNAMLEEVRLDKRQMEMGMEEFRNLPLNEQLAQFLYARTLSTEQVRIRWQLVLDILFILRHTYPMCELHAFGSLISGLGDMSSDIDIYVDLPGPYATKPMSSVDALHRTHRIFKKQKCPHTAVPFHSGPIVPVVHARVPVLKMKHLGSLISFDLSFENRLSAQNSRLLVFYTNMDPRVFRFIVLIRYWLKFHQLCGSNDIKNYALCLLSLVYLMQKGIIPSVYFLQKLKEAERKQQSELRNLDEIDGWDSSFCDNIELINQEFQAMPIPPDFHENPARHLLEMALEFFKMCAHTDLGSVVVCPFLGEIMLKGGFIAGNEMLLTDMLDRYKNFVQDCDVGSRLRLKSPLCIQDPFVLNFNVTFAAPLATVLKFQIAAAKTVEVLTNKLNGSNGGSGEALSLMDLFTPLPSHFKYKDFQRYYRIDTKRKKNSKEILTALGRSELLRGKYGGEDEGMEQQRNKYTKLPRHLASVEQLLDRDSYQKWQRETFSSDLVLLSLQQLQFTAHFMVEMARCGLTKPSNDRGYSAEVLKLVRKLTSLWKEFTVDFLKRFFVEALKLSAVGEVAEVSAPADVAEMEELCGIENRQNWKIQVPDKVNQRDEERKKKFRQAVKEIKDIPEDEANYYALMSFQVSYPFWNRPFTLDKWKEGEGEKTMAKTGKVEYKGNPIKVEGVISDNVLKLFEGKGKEPKDGKENAGGGDNAGDTEENQLKIKRARMDKEKFVPFKIDVLVKMVTNLGDTQGRTGNGPVTVLERPAATLIFQSQEKAGRDYRNAVSKLSSILNNIYPAYQMYRMDEWIAKVGGEEGTND